MRGTSTSFSSLFALSPPLSFRRGVCLLLLLFVALASLCDAYFMEDIQSLHLEDIIRVYCPTANSNTNNHAQFIECVETTRKNVRSLKLGEFYTHKAHFLAEVQRSLMTQNYSLSPDGRELSLLGGVVNFHKKLSTLQDVADDKRVENICEVGFFGGMSTLNLLASNPTASLVVFDADPLEKYSKVAINAILNRFPERSITFVHGELKHTLRNFQEQFGHVFRCNLLFVHGRQDEDTIMNTLKYMLPLMDPAFNRIVVDNFEQPAVHNSYHYITNKIKVGVQCPSLSPKAKERRAALNLTGETKEVTATRTGGSATRGCAYKVDPVQLIKGATYTPCVAMYADQTNGLHMEFLFSLQHCRADPVPEGEVLQYAEDEALEMLVSSVVYS